MFALLEQTRVFGKGLFLTGKVTLPKKPLGKVQSGSGISEQFVGGGGVGARKSSSSSQNGLLMPTLTEDSQATAGPIHLQLGLLVRSARILFRTDLTQAQIHVVYFNFGFANSTKWYLCQIWRQIPKQPLVRFIHCLACLSPRRR